MIVGPAGLELMRDHRTLMLSTGAGGPTLSNGKLYTLPINSDGRPGGLHQLWESGPADAPDGFAIAQSGNIYIALVGPAANAVLELSPTGQQLARIPATPLANNMQQVPFDSPGSVSFLGNQVIVTNQSAINNDPSHWALLEVNAGEPGMPLYLPPISSQNRYRLRVRPGHARTGHAIAFHFTATVKTASGRRKPLRGAVIHFAGHTVRTNRKGHATITVTLKHKGRYRARLTRKRRKLTAITVRVGP